MKDWAKHLLGGVVVYAFIACGGGERAMSPSSGVSASGAGGSEATGGAPEETDAGMMSAIVDPVPSAMAEHTSGSRIKVRYFTTADGAKAPAGFWDESLQTECSFTTTQAGIRCIPTAPPIVARAAVDEYGDQSCSVILTESVQCAPKFAVVASLDSACPSSISYLFSEIVRVHGGTVYQKVGNDCLEASTQNGNTRYVIGAPVSIEAFAAASVVTE